MNSAFKVFGLVTFLTMTASGCAFTAGAVAGAVAGSELEEDDGQFDPGEDTEIGEEIYE